MANENPGQYTGKTATMRDCLMSKDGVRLGRGTIDASKAYNGADTYPTRLWPGTPMGRITTSKLWVPCKRTKVNMADATTTSLVVDNSYAFKVGDVISVGADTGITITAIDYATHTLTIASTAVADNEDVIVADGSAVCRGILNEEVDLYDEFTRSAKNKAFGNLVIAGLVDPNKCQNDITNIRADTGNKLSFVQFGDDAGQV